MKQQFSKGYFLHIYQQVYQSKSFPNEDKVCKMNKKLHKSLTNSSSSVYRTFLMPWLGIFSLLWVSPGRVFWFWKPSPSLSIMSWKKNNCRIFLCCFFCKLQLLTFPREDFFSKEVKISKIYSSTWKQQFWRKLVTKFSPQKCCGLLNYFFLSMKNTLKRRSIGL